MLKVVLVDAHSLLGTDYGIVKEILNKNGIDFYEESCRNDEEVIEKCKDADGIMTILTKIHEGIFEKLEKCKVVVRYGIGYDAVDLQAAGKKDIVVCNIPSYCEQDVATHTLALILDLGRKITMFDRSVRRKEWNSNYGYPVHRMDRLTLGLIGFGGIARYTAQYAAPLGFKIITYDPFVTEDVCKAAGVTKVSFDELLGGSDIISVHVPLNADTKHLINKNTIAKMKQTAMVINTSRGPIIAQDDLFEALKNKRILAAGLDVLEIEPLAHPYAMELDNLVITPHIGYNSIEATIDLHTKVAETACNVLKGEMPPNIVNKQYLKRLNK